jgi:hypothetical protein
MNGKQRIGWRIGFAGCRFVFHSFVAIHYEKIEKPQNPGTDPFVE